MALDRIEWLNFYRNVKGRYDLLRFLYKWDPDYRKDLIVTALAFTLFFYSIATFNSFLDLIAMIIEAAILRVQLGGEMSVLPADYRPTHGGVRYTAEPSTHIAFNEMSFLMSGVLPEKSEEDAGFAPVMIPQKLCRESALASDRVNDTVMLRDKIPYTIDGTETNYIRSRHQLRYIAIRVADKKTHTTNGMKLAFYDLASSLAGNGPVTLRKSFYFDALLTAEAFRSRIFRNNIRKDKEVYTDLTTYFPVVQEKTPWQYGLRFEHEFFRKVSGHIGITSLLLSENKRVVMLHQGATKAIGAKTAVLGGSGSLDYDDMARAGNPDDMRRIIIEGMARETAEETGMQSRLGEIRDNTMITGFFRWIDRCGKPEFTGLTRAGNIKFTAENAIDGDEVVGYEEIPVTINTPEDFSLALDWLTENNIRLGLSAFMTLHRLTVIASYNTPDATPEQRHIYDMVARFIA